MGFSEVVGVEAEPGEDFARPGVGIVAAHIVEVRVEMAEGVIVPRPFSLGDRPFHGPQPGISVQHEVEGGTGGRLHRLLETGEPPGLGPDDLARFRKQPTPHQFEQGRLADAVAPDNPGLVSGMDRQAEVVEQDPVAATQRYIDELEHG